MYFTRTLLLARFSKSYEKNLPNFVPRRLNDKLFERQNYRTNLSNGYFVVCKGIRKSHVKFNNFEKLVILTEWPMNAQVKTNRP